MYKLETLCYSKLYCKKDRFNAAYLISLEFDLDKKCNQIFSERSIKKDCYISSSDRHGLDIELSLEKSSGTIDLVLHKKRSTYALICFKQKEEHIKVYDRNSNFINCTMIQCLLREYPVCLFEYLSKGMSNKWESLTDLIHELKKSKTSIKFQICTTNNRKVYKES